MLLPDFRLNNYILRRLSFQIYFALSFQIYFALGFRARAELSFFNALYYQIMNVIRFILFVIVALILWRFVRQWYQDFKQDQMKKEAEPPPKTLPYGTMVRCDYCGLYLPFDEAINLEEQVYCCDAHKQAAQQKSNVQM
ncbi:MAG: hypothetical protein DRR16_23175 [Candidatus Parabeggiatoa sp. nov. 3]|nr:MAG: hypothetical protein DRQ99_04630 [Gammaproteobacteria bacterium]RKZ80845.1 MAG: hypothetical protein DRR16_23175 [Gammaproteobacteria bacterium]